MTRIPPLKRGQLPKLARLLERHVNTVRNWQTYGRSERLTDEEWEEVEAAVGELLNDKGKVDGRRAG